MAFISNVVKLPGIKHYKSSRMQQPTPLHDLPFPSHSLPIHLWDEKKTQHAVNIYI
jgi:hypothetical protein